MFSVKVSRGWTPGVMKWWPHALKKTTIRKIGLRLTIFGNGSYSLMRAMMSQTSLLILFAMFSFCADIDGTYSWNKGLWDDETCWIHLWKYSTALFWHKHFSRVFFFFPSNKNEFSLAFFFLKKFSRTFEHIWEATFLSCCDSPGMTQTEHFDLFVTKRLGMKWEPKMEFTFLKYESRLTSLILVKKWLVLLWRVQTALKKICYFFSR